MAIITDPDQLNQGTEINFDTNQRTIELLEAGNLSSDGVTLQAVYSFSKEEWLTDANLTKHPFPLLAITREQYEFGNNGSQYSGWKPKDDSTRLLIRTAGWAEYDDSGNKLREYAGIITLGGPESDDQPYYELEPGTATNFSRQGPVNEAIQIYGDADNGDLDRRTHLVLFVREYAQTYNRSSLSDIGVSSLENIVYRFPLSTAADTKIQDDDATVSSSAPYTNMSITYYTTAQQRSIGGTDYDFHVIIDGADATAEQIYTFVQYQLRQNSDIDAGSNTIIGKVASPLLEFVGDTLKTKYVDESAQVSGVVGGTYIDNYDSNDINRLVFTDDTQTERTEPFTAAGSIVFNANLKNDTSAKYFMFFQYTKSQTGTDIAVTSASGNTATITSTSTDLSNISNGDQFTLEGFTTADNNGVWEATADGTTTSVAAEKVDRNQGIADESAGASVTVREHVFGTTSALLVQDKSGSDITGDISGAASASFTFDYDGNTQGGRSAGADAPVVVWAQGLDTAQYVYQEFAITRATGLTFTMNANLERNYSNP